MADGSIINLEQTNLSSLIKEAFIDPIRSVLIIDDEYPTWEQIFGDEGFDANDRSRWAENSDMLKVIKQFRKQSPALTVDIHNGSKNEEIGDYLHQSDLLVLDYQLEKTEPHGNSAVEIINSLLSNHHFNLIVMHTAISDLNIPFNRILMSLLLPMNIEADQVSKGFELVEAYENSNVNAVSDINAIVTEGIYIAYRKAVTNGKTAKGFITSTPMSAFRNICADAGWNDFQEQENVFLWSISDHDRRLSSEESKPEDIRWNSPNDSDWPWIRTNRGFIAFTHKTDSELLKTLGNALEDWKPTPSRMIAAKIRSQINAQGVIAENNVLADKHAYWKYYQNLLENSGDREQSDNRRTTLIEAHAARHTERIFDAISKETIEFGLKLVRNDPKTINPEATDGYETHYNVNARNAADRQLALMHYNSYISMKPVSGWHLQPGHVFSACDELWVCVSPACDLVPMQKAKAAMHGSEKSSTKPFLAVQLHQRNNPSQSEINSNSLIFYPDDTTRKVKSYSVYEGSGAGASPIWRLFLAENYGRFTINNDRTANIVLKYITGDYGIAHVKKCDGKIVAHLRYEYALNLVQKLGVEFTRIGLDFVSSS